MNINILQNEDINYLENLLLDENGQLKILPYEELKEVPQSHISLFCVRHGVYNIPTKEMVEFLRSEFGGYINQTIEIGAGNGVLAKELGITATDNRMQEDSTIKDMYNQAGQSPVKYGDNIVNLDAVTSLKVLKPRIALGCWVTHIYNPKEHFRGGNMFGIDEHKVIRTVKKYVFVGNEETHKLKPILEIPHRTLKFEWLLSRSLNKELNVIWIWER